MRIKGITLFTNNIDNQKQFYQDVLGFELVFNSEEKITFKAGSSILSFQYKKEIKREFGQVHLKKKLNHRMSHLIYLLIMLMKL